MIIAARRHARRIDEKHRRRRHARRIDVKVSPRLEERLGKRLSGQSSSQGQQPHVIELHLLNMCSRNAGPPAMVYICLSSPQPLQNLHRQRFPQQAKRVGNCRDKKKSHGATARARRHARSAQRVHPRTAKTPKERVLAPRPRRSPQRVARAPQESQQPRVFAPRPRRSPQRVARADRNRKKNLEFLHLDHADPRRGSRAQIRNRRKP